MHCRSKSAIHACDITTLLSLHSISSCTVVKTLASLQYICNLRVVQSVNFNKSIVLASNAIKSSLDLLTMLHKFEVTVIDVVKIDC